MRVDRYALLERLGAGGKGEVYRARQSGLGIERIVAVKRLYADRGPDVEALVEEARILLPLRHGNLVSVIDLVASEDESQLYLVLEYVEGASLEALLEVSPSVEPAIALAVARAAAEGMRHAHEHSDGAVLHLDLSPDNILVSRDGEVKITDFGSGRRVSVPGKTGLVQGKWPYMSPEQIRGERLGPKSDVWSLGVVLFQLVTGALPFDGPNASAVREAVLRGTRAEAPPALDGLFDEVLEPRPERRASIARLVERIDAATEALGVARGPLELGRWVAARQHPTAPDPRAARALAALGLGGELRRLTAASDDRAPPSSPPPAVDGGPTDVRLVRPTAEEVADTRLVGPKPDPVVPDTVVRPTAEPPARAPRAARAWIAVAVMLTAGAVAWALRGETPEPPPGPGEPSADSARAPTPSVVPRGAASPERPPSTDAEPAVEPAPPRTLATQKRVGTLRIFAVPWGYVWVDGRATHATLALPAGLHRVVVENPVTKQRASTRVEVRADDAKVIRLELE